MEKWKIVTSEGAIFDLSFLKNIFFLPRLYGGRGGGGGGGGKGGGGERGGGGGGRARVVTWDATHTLRKIVNFHKMYSDQTELHD